MSECVHPAVSFCPMKLVSPTLARSLCTRRLIASVSLLLLSLPATASASSATPGSQLRPTDYRVAAIAHRIAIRGARFCPALRPVTGLLLQHLGEYAPKDRAEAIRTFSLDRGPGLLAVVEESAAAEAGFVAGDVLLSVNGTGFPSPSAAASEPDENKRRQLMEAAETQLDEQLSRGAVRFNVQRNDRRLELVLQPQPGCPARARLARSKQPNAFADGRYAIITTKMLDFMHNDDELAIALAHELAHNILGHPSELKQKGVPSGILRNFGKNASRVLRTEEEADRLGIKLAWAAGYDVSAAAPFWQRLYAKYDPIPTPKPFRTHPTLSARKRIIEETIAELGALQSQPGAERP